MQLSSVCVWLMYTCVCPAVRHHHHHYYHHHRHFQSGLNSKNYCKDHWSGVGECKGKCNWKSNSFVTAAEQVCLQSVLEHRQRLSVHSHTRESVHVCVSRTWWTCWFAAVHPGSTRPRCLAPLCWCWTWSTPRPPCCHCLTTTTTSTDTLWTATASLTCLLRILVVSVWGHCVLEPLYWDISDLLCQFLGIVHILTLSVYTGQSWAKGR